MKSSALRRSLLLLTLGCTLLAPAVSLANDTQPPPAPQNGPAARGGMFNPERRLARLTERLALTAEQQAKILPLFQAQADEIKALNNSPLTEDERREKIRQIQQDNRYSIVELLTPEQRAQHAEMRKEMRGPRGEQGPRRKQGEHPEAPPPPPAPAD